jgi:polyferredoxin
VQPERIPLAKVFDVPFLSLDGTSVEMASLVFLFLATMVIANVGRRRQLVRRFVQATSLVVFFYVVYSCLGVFGMIRNGLHGLTLVGSAYTESFYWMALPVVVIAVTVITGPLFCGWICPTGTLQDIAGFVRKRLRRRSVRVTGRTLALVALALAGFLGLVIWLSLEKQMFIEDSSLHWAASLLLLVVLVIAGVIEDVPTRRLRLLSITAILVTAVSNLVITSPVHFAFTSRSDPASALATLVIMAAALFVGRSFCRYLCPWGYLMGLLSGLSRLRIAHDATRCSDCHRCEQVCDIGAIDAGAIRREHCQMCYACVDHCPKGAMTVVDAWQRGAVVPGAPVRAEGTDA